MADDPGEQGGFADPNRQAETEYRKLRVGELRVGE
jgi:hypothetical protein